MKKLTKKLASNLPEFYSKFSLEHQAFTFGKLEYNDGSSVSDVEENSTLNVFIATPTLAETSSSLGYLKGVLTRTVAAPKGCTRFVYCAAKLGVKSNGELTGRIFGDWVSTFAKAQF